MKLVSMFVFVATAMMFGSVFAGEPKHSLCAKKVELWTQSAPEIRIEVPAGAYVCWASSKKGMTILGDNTHFSVDVLARDATGEPLLAGVQGVAGYSSSVYIEDGGRRATLFVSAK